MTWRKDENRKAWRDKGMAASASAAEKRREEKSKMVKMAGERKIMKIVKINRFKRAARAALVLAAFALPRLRCALRRAVSSRGARTGTLRGALPLRFARTLSWRARTHASCCTFVCRCLACRVPRGRQQTRRRKSSAHRATRCDIRSPRVSFYYANIV
jgi:hypothetical protein